MGRGLRERVRVVLGRADGRTRSDGGVTVESESGTADADPTMDGDQRGEVSGGNSPNETGRNDSSAAELDFDDQLLLDGLGIPTFVLNADGIGAEWNAPIAELTGADRSEAIGAAHVSELFYPDGRRAQTLADKVLEAPRRAHEVFDVELRDAEAQRYGDTSTMIDCHGNEKHIDFSATPLFEDGELFGVTETVIDRSNQAKDATERIVAATTSRNRPSTSFSPASKNSTSKSRSSVLGVGRVSSVIRLTRLIARFP